MYVYIQYASKKVPISRLVARTVRLIHRVRGDEMKLDDNYIIHKTGYLDIMYHKLK